MIIYEVNLDVDAEAAGAFAAWLGPHIAEILALEGFEGADWWERDPIMEGRDGEARALWTVQYRLRDRAALEDYLAHHAARLRGDGLARFAGRFTASRRVLAPRGAQ